MNTSAMGAELFLNAMDWLKSNGTDVFFLAAEPRLNLFDPSSIKQLESVRHHFLMLKLSGVTSGESSP